MMLTNLANKFRRVTSNQLYIPEIDGLRFLSLITVTLFHINGYFLNKTNIHFADNRDKYYWFNNFLSHADRGVLLFFSISGFILAIPFANYYLNNGKKISLKMYFLRRLTRLEPPYFIAMIGIFLATLTTHQAGKDFQTLFPSLLASLTYSHNIVFHHTPLITVVAWSLEIEVQFYIMAPLLFHVFRLTPIFRRSILIMAICVFVILQHYFASPVLCIYGFIQYFLVGILMADFYLTGFAMRFFSRNWLAWVTPVIFVAMFLLPDWTQETQNADYLWSAIMFPVLIALLFIIALRNETIKSMMSYKFIPIIGGMCYTTYLLHYTIISFCGRLSIQLHLTNYFLPNLLLQIILLLIPILIISSTFYFYVERPFMSKKWVDKLMGKKEHK